MMNKSLHPEIHFLRVTDANTKLNRIVSTASQHYLSGERVIIFVPNEQAAAYIDDLLWRRPHEGFLPHLIAKESIEEAVVITLASKNISRARIAMNLKPGLCADLNSFEKVYELSDQTDPVRTKLSLEKIQGYQKLGLLPL